ncbi:helix-turn-helix transcriptional regulator [Sphingopyxis sp.]|uniref:helix-turn-helix transcriptional regulator n=1 Tax=Sphingopyxis sp. TaxID=1908224 RepID=UPI003D6CB338
MTASVNVLNHYEAAALIGITPATLRFWRCKGKGPRFIKLGQSKQAGVCYDPADIEAWKAARKFASTSAATVQYPATA